MALALPGFNDLKRSVTPLFDYKFESCRMHHRIRYVLLCLSVGRFQMPLEGLSFVILELFTQQTHLDKI